MAHEVPILISNEFHTVRCFPALHCSWLGAKLPGNSRIICISNNIGRPWYWFRGHPFLNENSSIQLDHLVSFPSHVVPCLTNSFSYQSCQYGWDPKFHKCSPEIYTKGSLFPVNKSQVCRLSSKSLSVLAIHVTESISSQFNPIVDTTTSRPAETANCK